MTMSSLLLPNGGYYGPQGARRPVSLSTPRGAKQTASLIASEALHSEVEVTVRSRAVAWILTVVMCGAFGAAWMLSIDGSPTGATGAIDAPGLVHVQGAAASAAEVAGSTNPAASDSINPAQSR